MYAFWNTYTIFLIRSLFRLRVNYTVLSLTKPGIVDYDRGQVYRKDARWGDNAQVFVPSVGTSVECLSWSL